MQGTCSVRQNVVVDMTTLPAPPGSSMRPEAEPGQLQVSDRAKEETEDHCRPPQVTLFFLSIFGFGMRIFTYACPPLYFARGSFILQVHGSRERNFAPAQTMHLI